MKIDIYFLQRFNSVVLQLVVFCVLSLYSCDDSSPFEQKATIGIPTSQLSWNISHESKTIDVEVVSARAWKVETDDQTSSWLTVSPKEGNGGKYTLRITVSENKEETKRTGKITVASDTVRKEITVVQNGLAASIEIPSNQLSWNISHESKTIDVEVVSARAWKVETDDQTSSWLTVSPKEGNGGKYTLRITVSENKEETKRTGKITVASSTVRKEITVVQNGLAASIEIPSNQLSWNISHESKTIDVEVVSARAWKVETDDQTSSWLTVSPKEGNGGKYTLGISVSENKEETKRTGKITVTSGTVCKEITVVQNGIAASIEIPSNQLSWNISHESKTIDVEVVSARAWKVETDDQTSSWLTVSPKEGNGGKYTLRITVSENKEETKRTGKITVASGTVRKEITVVQNGLAASIEIPSNQLSWNISHESKTIDVEVVSARAWKVKTDDQTSSWLTVSPKEGNGGKYTLRITVSENKGETKRTGKITVSSSTVRKEITIIQKEYIFKPEDSGLEDMPIEEWN